MSTAVLPNRSANDDMEDVQCDSLRTDIPPMPEIYQALIDIDEEIGEEETEVLKFLCRDHIAVSKLDKAQTALEIFDMMHKLALIAENNYDYLLECLGRIHRVDLIKKLGFQPKAVIKHLPNFKKLLPFRILLMDITEDLDNQEAEKIQFFLRGKIRKKPLNEKRSLPQLFIILEQEGFLAHNNLDLLTDVLESIKRGDLVDMIREFQGLPPLQRHEPGLPRNRNMVIPSRHEVHIGSSPGTNERPPPQVPVDFETSGPPEENVCVSSLNAQPPMTAEQIPQQNTDPVQVLVALQQLNLNPNQIADQRCVAYVNNVGVYKQGNEFVANPGISQQLQPVVLPVTGQGQVIVGVAAVQGQGCQTQPLGAPQLPTYNMERKPRGWCVILNNEKFDVDSSHGNNQGSEIEEMAPRIGTERDAASLQGMFDKLGFIVRRYDNLTDTEMMTTLIDAAHNVDHTSFDCFVCCILSHGVLGHLYGSNGRKVSIKDLTSTFQTNRCPTLAGKPKLFFLQACQGSDKMEGGEIESDGPSPVAVSGDNVNADNDGRKEMIPNEADFLLGYATVPGYVSFRSRNHGSWYIRKLCELLEKYSGSYDLMTILVEVNNHVAAANASVDGGTYKQIPAPLVTLRKRIFFR